MNRILQLFVLLLLSGAFVAAAQLETAQSAGKASLELLEKLKTEQEKTVQSLITNTNQLTALAPAFKKLIDSNQQLEISNVRLEQQLKIRAGADQHLKFFVMSCACGLLTIQSLQTRWPKTAIVFGLLTIPTAWQAYQYHLTCSKLEKEFASKQQNSVEKHQTAPFTKTTN